MTERRPDHPHGAHPDTTRGRTPHDGRDPRHRPASSRSSSGESTATRSLARPRTRRPERTTTTEPDTQPDHGPAGVAASDNTWHSRARDHAAPQNSVTSRSLMSREDASFAIVPPADARALNGSREQRRVLRRRWRREWDSNPRGSSPNGFQDRPVRPLRHPSECGGYVLRGATRSKPVKGRSTSGTVKPPSASW